MKQDAKDTSKLQTHLNKGWLLKMVIIGVVLGVFGLWGALDALVVYPSRGERYASFAELQYLAASNQAGLLLQASIPNPQQELDRLEQAQSRILSELRQASEGSLARSRLMVEQTKLHWLTSLSRIGKLQPESTVISNPRQRVQELDARWQSSPAPKELRAFDIPLQWIIFLGGLSGSLYMVYLIYRASRTVYQFDTESLELTLPSGFSFRPSEIAELDKRKWHKYFVEVVLKENKRRLKLDLLRHEPLEDWILQMEKLTDWYDEDATDEQSARKDADDEATDPGLAASEP